MPASKYGPPTRENKVSPSFEDLGAAASALVQLDTVIAPRFQSFPAAALCHFADPGIGHGLAKRLIVHAQGPTSCSGFNTPLIASRLPDAS